ncbi:uncharacterized protein LOC111320509 [Stylophora pistillata]|uniref:uncharacterized protein LOC111320509 n=1 Tax=Stylophora pistillata TaxID=50429 RepID=UPI000C052AD7|nr:uncharacterized protein LOC111320509 [Stylophora pistillata]
MTLNAENSQTLLESYVLLARQVKCPEYDITDTHSSQDTKIDKTIKNLKDLIATKLHLYASWLMVVDNVTSVSAIHTFLPQSGNEQWNKGQLLITTQDTSSIPSTCSFISHVSIMKGMEPLDAKCFLANISSLEDSEMEDEVAKALDYQPLALASAGTYVKKIRESVASDFGWKEYLDKLKRGMRALTEKELTKTNPSYSTSMTAATKLAVEKAIDSGGIMKNAFTFLSLCAHQALPLDILINYLLNIDKQVEREELAVQIQGYSLLLLEKRENGVFIGVHQVTHEVIKSVICESHDHPDYAQAVHGAITAYN